jgi:hypothetical protein
MAKTQKPAPDAPVGEAHEPAAPAFDEKALREWVADRIAAATAPKPREPAASFDDAGIKSWIRREIHLAMNGASEAEREVMNP